MARPIFSMDDVLGEQQYSDDSDVEEEETEKCGDEHEVEQEEETNIKHTSKRSWVWSHFTYDENAKKARCNLCKNLITCNKGSTSGMAFHAKKKHNISKNQENTGRQLTLQESIKNSSEIIVSVI